MKYLIIEKNRAFYQLNNDISTKKSIDQISKEDLLTLVELCMEEDSFEMDPFDARDIPHAAHQIIYKNIYQKLNDLRLHRVSFTDEKTSLYHKAIDSYMTELDEL